MLAVQNVSPMTGIRTIYYIYLLQSCGESSKSFPAAVELL